MGWGAVQTAAIPPTVVSGKVLLQLLLQLLLLLLVLLLVLPGLLLETVATVDGQRV